MRVTPLLVSIGALAPLTGCTEHGSPSSAQIVIEVAPLTLDEVTNARYTLSVQAGGKTVWTRAVDADRYGDGRGGLSYVGPCDASPEAQPNRVTVVLQALVSGDHDVPSDTWQNPTPVSLDVPCRENADTLARFDLVILRDAVQGFFDIAVNFEDIFCSAKFDCQRELLHDGAGERALTAVLAFACAAGNTQETVLYLSDIEVTCDGLQPVTVDPSLGPGQRPLASAPLFAVGGYWGKEAFPDVDKCYWNTALGLALSAEGPVNPRDCHVTAIGTAAEGALPAHTTPGNTRYPIIEWNVPITDANGNLMCQSHPLGNDSLTVRTRYSDLAGERLDHPYSCGGRPARVCSGNARQVAGSEITVADLGDGLVRVEVEGATLELQLPAEAVLDNDAGCCVAPCCDSASE